MKIEETKKRLAAIEAAPDFKPTDWEKKFLKSINNDLDKGLGVSTHENLKISEIYRKAYFNFEEATCPK